MFERAPLALGGHRVRSNVRAGVISRAHLYTVERPPAGDMNSGSVRAGAATARLRGR